MKLRVSANEEGCKECSEAVVGKEYFITVSGVVGPVIVEFVSKETTGGGWRRLILIASKACESDAVGSSVS